ncbi:MAG: 4Fe-4S dicluster domain-containing protein, partial [Firmicutes bacterium]|nr:4Fe-4S dicluster domain-containing protein [Bacillota bacterium]
VFMGGPMMGINIYDDSLPVLKNNNAIIALSKADRIQMPESNCIRCGRCVAACPERLLPAMIDRAVYRNDIEALRHYKVNLCLECGCCAYVCPAKRQLVLSNRLGKRKLREADMAKKAKEGQNGK